MGRWCSGALALAALGLLTAPLATATPVAGDLRMVERPGLVRVIVPLAGGAVSDREGGVEALDPQAGDGRAVILLPGVRVAAGAAPATRAGISARLARRPGGARLVVDAPPRRLAFVAYRALRRPDRLVVALWRGDVTSRAAARRDDGCLRITAWAGGRGVARLRGLERRPLFEHSLVISLRDGQGRVLAERPLIARPGRFRADFSGYLTPGRWRGVLAPAVPAPRRAMLEAWVASARDGSLECLVRVPVRVSPRRPAAG